MMINNKISICIILLLGIILSSCKDEEKKYHTVFEKIQDIESTYVEYSRIDKIDTAKYIEVKAENSSFFINRRTTKITSFDCIECHSEPLDKLKRGTKNDEKKAHWEIKLTHTSDDLLNCNTCHTENNMSKLHSLVGKEISFDQSYKLCSQCHSPQYRDWKGGAHGKQVDGWKKPRISRTCTDCHSPHDPSFKHRWPSRLVEKEFEKK